MNQWANTVLTDKGRALMAKLTQGNTLNITRAVTGAGFVTPGLLAKQTEITDPKQALTFRPVSYPETGKCAITVALKSDGLATGYTAKQVGLYAEDPDEGEILLFISQAADEQSGTIIPSATEMPGYSSEWTFYLQYGQADGVNVTVDPANTVTRTELEQALAEDVTWENVRNKPTVMAEETSDTVTWDGDTTDLEKTVNAAMYKVSDVAPTYSDAVSAGVEIIVCYDGESEVVGTEELTITPLIENSGFSIKTAKMNGGRSIAVLVANIAGAKSGSVTAPSPGVYLSCAFEGYFVASMRVPGYTEFPDVMEKMDPSVLYKPDWNQNDRTNPEYIKNKPQVVVSGNGGDVRVKKILASLDDLEAGVSELETGTLYLVFEI